MTVKAMATKPARPGLASTAGSNPLPWIVGVLGATLALQFPLVIGRAVNWDEFFHYSQIGRLARGTLTEPLQTLYTRAFEWVLDLPGTGVDHVIVIRLFMLACELVTVAAIVGMASRFTDRTTGVLCAIAYVSMAYVFKHGTSFRFDPPAAALLMGSAWILLRSRLGVGAILSMGLLAGISTILTIKTVLYAPVFAGIAWLRWAEGGRRGSDAVRLAALGIWTLVTAGLVYLLHASTLAAGSEEQARGIITSASSNMFNGNELYGHVALFAIALAPVLAAAVLAAPFVIWRSDRPGREKLALLGMWLPLTTLLFYHNTAPYYYAYMLPPVVVAASPAFALASRRYSPVLIAVVIMAFALVTFLREPENPIERQRAIQSEAERMFPGGVAYFDSYAMLGAFPKANVFMTPWGIRRYLAGEMPSMVNAMAVKPVPLMLDNDATIHQALTTTRRVPDFREEDLAAIRETYVPAWGAFWIAGRDVPARSENLIWNARVPGPYTVRDGELAINGRSFEAGDVVRLDRGRHVLTTGDRGARLLWGDNIKLPTRPAPEGPLVMPF